MSQKLRHLPRTPIVLTVHVEYLSLRTRTEDSAQDFVGCFDTCKKIGMVIKRKRPSNERDHNNYYNRGIDCREYYISTMAAPKKYVKINGVMKLNPEYKRWQESQTGAGTATSLPNSAQALPVVSSMEDHMQLNDDLGTNIPLAESTDATIEMMQDPDFCADAGMNPDTVVDELGSVLSKYEVPMGLMNKVRCSIFMMSTKCINSFRSLHISPFASIY